MKRFKNSETPRYLVGDSKVYYEDNAYNISEITFITRIPRTHREESKAVAAAISADQWALLDEENKYYVHATTHFDIPQRWIVVHSTSAASRSEKTLNKQIEKDHRAAEHLYSNKKYDTEKNNGNDGVAK